MAEFHNAATLDALAEFGHVIRGPCGAVAEAEEKGQPLTLYGFCKVRNVRFYRGAHIGVRHGAKVVKVFLPGVSIHIDTAGLHGVILLLGRGVPQEKRFCAQKRHRSRSQDTTNRILPSTWEAKLSAGKCLE